jgi:hypothetical protein
VIAQVIGMLAAASFLNAYPAWTSPLTRATNGADASVFMGALFAGAIYFWLARPSVPTEAERSIVGEPPDVALGTATGVSGPRQDTRTGRPGTVQRTGLRCVGATWTG